MRKIPIILILLAGPIYFYMKYYNVEKQDDTKIVLRVVKLKGRATVEFDHKTTDVSEKMIIENHSLLQTSDHSVVLLGYGKDFSSKIKIGPNASVDLSKYNLNLPDQKEGLSLRVMSGDLLLKIFNPSKQKVLTIQTNTTAMGVRGTTFLVKAESDNSLLLVKEGTVEVENKNTNKSSFATAGTGYKIASTGEPQYVDVNIYKTNWDIDSQDPELIPNYTDANNDILSFPQKIESALKKMNAQVEDKKIFLGNKKAQLTLLTRATEGELAKFKDDRECINKMLKGCELKTNALITDVTNLQDQSKRFVFTEPLKEILTNNLIKYESQLKSKLQASVQEAQIVEEETTALEKKYQLASAKYEGLKSLDEAAKKEKTQYKEIVDNIDSNELKNDYQKIK